MPSSAFGRTLSWAGVLQWTGHVLGAAVALYLLHRVLTSGSLLRWYGVSGDDFASRPPPAGSTRFWMVTAVGSAAGLASAAIGEPGIPGQIIRLSLGVAAGLVAASAACAAEAKSADASTAELARGAAVPERDRLRRRDGMTNDMQTRPDRDRPTLVVGAFGAALVGMGGLGFVTPEAGASSTAPAYDGFHVAGGLVALALAKTGPPGRQPGVSGRLRRGRPLPGPRQPPALVPRNPVPLDADRRPPPSHRRHRPRRARCLAPEPERGLTVSRASRDRSSAAWPWPPRHRRNVIPHPPLAASHPLVDSGRPGLEPGSAAPVGQEQPLVVPQLEQTKQAPARCMTMPHW